MKKISLFFQDAKPFSQLVGLFFIFLVCLILSGGLLMLLPSSTEGEGGVRLGLIVQAVSQLLTFLLPVLLFAIVYKPHAADYFKLGFQGRYWWLAFVAMVIVLLLAPFNDVVNTWNNGWNLGPLETYARELTSKNQAMIDRLLSLTSFGDVCLQLLVVALAPAICEELFFRGGVQQILHDWWGNKHAAVLVTALLFTLAHGDLYGLVPRFVMGVVLGYLFICSGSILVNVCAHFFNNAIVVVLYLLYHKGIISVAPTDPLSMPWHVVVLCTVGALLLFVVYFVKKTSK